MSNFAEWIAQVSDRSLIALWQQYAAPTVSIKTQTKQELDRACLIVWEMMDRNLLPVPDQE